MKHVFRYAIVLGALVIGVLVMGVRGAAAQTLAPEQRLCDPEFEDCRADVLQYIAQENVEIDVGFWMMTDARYSNALVSAWQRGVKIRLLMDPRCSQQHPACTTQQDQLQNAGIPMRNRTTSGILHWKMMIFAGQGQLEFAGANYAPFEMSPDIPYQNYTDEVVMFTNDPSILQSFMTKFDDLWTSTTEFANFANITGPLTRSYATYPIDPQLNFPPDDSYRTRAINAYNAETAAIDVAMFRITDAQESSAIIAALQRGVPVRLYTDQTEYRNPSRLWDAYNVDRMWYAGAQVRIDDHQGINHEKAVMLKSQGMSIFGSSNWTSPSTDSQREHNMFTTQPWIFTWLENQFNRKWTNGSGYTESQPFTPLPPDQPAYNLPANGATGVTIPSTGLQLSWYAGPWGQLYDIYFGTTPNPPLIAQNQQLGPSQYSTDYRYFTIPSTITVQPGTKYYWQIVSKTMAYVTDAGPVWSFTTAGTAPNDAPPTVSLTSPANNATYTAPATITLTASASDSDGTVSKVDFYNGTTLLGTATASPYTFTWSNVPSGTYSLTAVATDNGNMTATSNAVSVTVSNAPPPPSTLPSGWSNQDVGSTGAPGSSSYSNGTFTVTGAGADVWGSADAFQYAFTQVNGDGTIVARVATVGNTASWFKAGVMIRNNLTAGSAQGFMLVSYAKGTAFQRRLVDGNTSVSTTGVVATAPYWVKLVRAGSTITAYESPDGATWTQVGSDTFTMGTTVYFGLAVSSHVNGVLGTATFDNVSVVPATNTPPSVSITSPANGATYTAPANITLTASASDSDGTVSKVDFYSGTTLLGTATTSPYTITWNNVPAGTYSVTAVATDNFGATTTSAAVSVTVGAADVPPAVSLTSPANGATYTAPASITLTASASDSDGTVSKVDFYSGTTLLGTATASPYTFTWNNVPAGTYSLTAVATDNGGLSTTSSAVSVTVNSGSTSTLPAGWSDSDVGTVPFPGSASYANPTFTVTGSGADIWGSADAFHYAYTQITGDTTIIARVASVQNVASWVKAGVMIRETLQAGSTHAFMLVSAAKGVAFQRRTVTNGTSTSTAGSLSTAPRWVKLVRSGSTFAAYESADGTTWTLVGSDTISMASTVYVGLAVTSHTTTASATCTFDSVTIQ